MQLTGGLYCVLLYSTLSCMAALLFNAILLVCSCMQ